VQPFVFSFLHTVTTRAVRAELIRRQPPPHFLATTASADAAAGGASSSQRNRQKRSKKSPNTDVSLSPLKRTDFSTTALTLRDSVRARVPTEKERAQRYVAAHQQVGSISICLVVIVVVIVVVAVVVKVVVNVSVVVVIVIFVVVIVFVNIFNVICVASCVPYSSSC
jgi:Flp pilus assembly protein TadB